MPRKERHGIRQGDVLLVPTDRVRNGEKMVPSKGRLIIAEGELTGHHHSVEATPDIAVLLSRDGMQVQGTGVMTHQEHDPHQLRDTYDVVEQRRAGPTAHQVLSVVD